MFAQAVSDWYFMTISTRHKSAAGQATEPRRLGLCCFGCMPLYTWQAQRNEACELHMDHGDGSCRWIMEKDHADTCVLVVGTGREYLPGLCTLPLAA